MRPRRSHHLRRDQNGWKFGQRQVLWSPDRFCGPFSRMWASVLQRRGWHTMAQPRQVKLKMQRKLLLWPHCPIVFWAKVLQEQAAPFYVLLACVGVTWGPNENSSCLSSSNDSNNKIILIVLVYSRCFFLGANCIQTCLSARDIFWTAVQFWSSPRVCSWWVPMSWCQVEFGARKPGMLNSAVLRERAFCEQHSASIFISYRRQDQTI